MSRKNNADGKLGRNVIVTGLTSFFTDISSEMIYPLIQAFVSAVMVSAQTLVGPILGVIEGVAEASASILKVYSGYISDKVRRRKALTIMGYSLSGISKLIYILAHFGWIFILLARFSDRVGKGIRTAPRDALIAESVDPGIKGKAYGFHRAMDYMGALLGVVVCYFISLKYMDPITGTITNLDSFYKLFLISVIPAAFGVICLFFVREEQEKHSTDNTPPVKFSFKGIDSRLKIFFIAVFIFTLGNSSNQFLLLKSMDAGISLPDVLLMYMLFNFITSILSTPLGSLSDKIGRKIILLSGYFLYSLVYIMFGYIDSTTSKYLWLFWSLYGIYYALTEGIEKALVADLAPADKRGTILGLFNMIAGIALLPASLLAGFLYSYAGSSYPFIFGGVMSGTAFLIIVIFLREERGIS